MFNVVSFKQAFVLIPFHRKLSLKHSNNKVELEKKKPDLNK